MSSRRPRLLLAPRLLALLAAVVIAAFAPLVSGVSALAEESDCATQHQGDGDEHCPPFCGDCLDCPGCFHVHALLPMRPPLLTVRAEPVMLPGRPREAPRPPEAPDDAPLHVPRRAG